MVERPAGEGDFVVIAFDGRIDGEPFHGGEARGFPFELGSGQLIPGFDEQLQGTEAGDELEVTATFPEDYPAEDLAGKEAAFAVTVKEVKEKRLPELDDDLAIEAGGFDTLDELREDIAGHLREAQEEQIERDFREAAVDAVAELAAIDLPRELIHAKAHEMWNTTARRLAAQGVDPARYLQLTNKTEEELVTESEPDAQSRRSDRRARQGDPGRAGEGARGHLDPGQGSRGQAGRKDLDPRLGRLAPPAGGGPVARLGPPAALKGIFFASETEREQ
jgi:trigger factor